MRHHDLSWFRPEPPQEQFIDSLLKETIYAGGVGSGKTLSGCVKALKVSLQFPGTVGLVGRQSYRALEDTTKKVMIFGDDKPAIIPVRMPGESNPKALGTFHPKDEKVVLDWGSEILFRSLEDSNIEKLLSLNLGWFYVDEVTETTLKVWLTLMGRLRHPVGPRIGWGTTNPNGHDWVWSRHHPDGTADPKGLLVIQPTDSNRRNLPPDYIEMLHTMPKEWQKRYVYASFDTAAGQILDMWDSNVHVIPSFTVPSTWKWLDCLDHGVRNPTAYLQIAVDHEGFMVVEREYYESGTIDVHAPVINTMRQGRVFGPVQADPQVFSIGSRGDTIAAIYQEYGVPMLPADNNVASGLLRMSQWLVRKKGRLFPEWHPWGGTYGPDGLGAPLAFVMDRCANLRSEIPDYRWKDLSTSAEATADQPEQPRKKNDHAVDAWRYGIMALPSPAPLPTVQHVPTEQEKQESGMLSAGIRDEIF